MFSRHSLGHFIFDAPSLLKYDDVVSEMFHGQKNVFIEAPSVISVLSVPQTPLGFFVLIRWANSLDGGGSINRVESGGELLFAPPDWAS
jgi:hypothetical protein